MWLQSRKVLSGHDLLPPSAAGEVSRAALFLALFLAFVDLTKVFDLVSRSGLFKIVQKISCPPKFLAIITSFHQDMQSTVCFDGATSNVFPVSSGVKQGCVLAPTLFGIFFSMLLQYSFVDCTEGVYVRTKSDSKLLNIARLRAKTKAYVVLIQKLLFADDAASTSHSEQGLQHLVDKLSHACKEFGLTIILRKTNTLAQGAEIPPPPPRPLSPSKTRSGRLQTPSPTWAPSSTSLDAEISFINAKAASVMAKLKKRVWGNVLLSERTKMCLYQACVLSTLLYCTDWWTTYSRQERQLNVFHISQGGLVVIYRASHHCEPGFNSRLGQNVG